MIINLVCRAKGCWKHYKNAKIERYSHVGEIDSDDLEKRLNKYEFGFLWENGEVVVYCLECKKQILEEMNE